MSKPIIAVDIDDVLADETSTILEFTNAEYGLNLTGITRLLTTAA
ncbi:MAG TPA: hypothetical protein VGG13_02935 [Candidatus Saccharimonadales bacterium]